MDQECGYKPGRKRQKVVSMSALLVDNNEEAMFHSNVTVKFSEAIKKERVHVKKRPPP